METRYFLDWAPFTTAAVQTLPIKSGVLAADEIELANIKSADIAEVAYVLRLDGIFIFAITYATEPSPTAVYWHAAKLSSHLRRITFGMLHLPPFESRIAWLFHTPTHVEDLGAATYLRKLGIPKEWRGYSAATPHERLVAIADNYIAIAAMCRRTDDPLRARHTALLHLKSQMGRRRNVLGAAFREQDDFVRKAIPGLVWSSLLTLLVVVVGLPLLAYAILQAFEVSFYADFVRFAVHLQTLNRWSWTNVLLLALLLPCFRVSWWWYSKSYKRQVFLLSTAAMYFSSCCQYGAVVSRLYERVDKNAPDQHSLNGPFYPHTRSFEGAVEDYKLMLQLEHMRLRDYGIQLTVVSIMAGLVVKLGSVLLPP